MSSFVTGIGASNIDKPPSAHALSCLLKIGLEATPKQEFNFTVVDKLLAFGYIKLEERLSPYPTHKGKKNVTFAVITEAGHAKLLELHGK